jgi:hypothetical protein
VTGYVVHISEELLELQTDFTGISLSLSYAEKEGDVQLVCESAGPPVNPLKEELLEDDIALKLILGRCKSVNYSYTDGKNVLVLRIKSD